MKPFFSKYSLEIHQELELSMNFVKHFIVIFLSLLVSGIIDSILFGGDLSFIPNVAIMSVLFAFPAYILLPIYIEYEVKRRLKE